MVRGKFRLVNISKNANYDSTKLVFDAVSLSDKDNVEENQKYHRYTPNGKIEMDVNNPEAEVQLQLGKYYYVDFTQCETQ